jgi:hypothetical protein
VSCMVLESVLEGIPSVGRLGVSRAVRLILTSPGG